MGNSLIERGACAGSEDAVKVDKTSLRRFIQFWVWNVWTTGGKYLLKKPLDLYVILFQLSSRNQGSHFYLFLRGRKVFWSYDQDVNVELNYSQETWNSYCTVCVPEISSQTCTLLWCCIYQKVFFICSICLLHFITGTASCPG